MSVKITNLEIENVKRVKAVAIEPSAKGLTIVGGRNGQGKTSVLDAIAWALGGDKRKPSEAQRKDSTIPPRIHLELSNGLIVERKGKSSALHVIDPSGQKAGQRLLDSFIEKLALDLPKFMQSSDKEKAETLLQIIGVGDELAKLDRQEQSLYNQRLEIGRIADRKKKHAEELTWYPDAPDEPVSASELIKQQQEILARNGDNQRKRDQLDTMLQQKADGVLRIKALQGQIASLKVQLDQYQAQDTQLHTDILSAQKTVLELEDESMVELEQSIANIDTINVKVRANADKTRAQAEAEELGGQYNDLSTQIQDVKRARMDLLQQANMPLPGLSVQDGELIYSGQKWDCMSGAEQLQVATAIVRCLNPECGFVLMDKLEQMDTETLAAFGNWLESEGLQVIATRVATDDSCSIIIEDGYVQGADYAPAKPIDTPKKAPKWEAGKF